MVLISHVFLTWNFVLRLLFAACWQGTPVQTCFSLMVSPLSHLSSLWSVCTLLLPSRFLEITVKQTFSCYFHISFIIILCSFQLSPQIGYTWKSSRFPTGFIFSFIRSFPNKSNYLFSFYLENIDIFFFFQTARQDQKIADQSQSRTFLKSSRVERQ